MFTYKYINFMFSKIKKEKGKRKGEKKLNVKITRGRKETGAEEKTRGKAEETKRRKKKKRERE